VPSATHVALEHPEAYDNFHGDRPSRPEPAERRNPISPSTTGRKFATLDIGRRQLSFSLIQTGA
jgi:hypothetical protein